MTEAVVVDTPGRRGWTVGAECRVPRIAAHDAFLARARSEPDALAVRQWDQRLTYRELADRATGLARWLRSAGVGDGQRVGVCMRRTPWLPASVLGVLIARGTFVPLDLDQPPGRLRGIAEDCGVSVALVDADGDTLLSGIVSHRLVADAGPASAGPGAGSGKPGRVSPDAAAYVMSTSGSTGRPKGVMVSHRNLMSFATAIAQRLGRPRGCRWAAFAALGFDASVFELFTPLVSGGPVYLIPDEDRIDPHRLQRFLAAHWITRVMLPPPLLPLLDPGLLPHLRELITGAEPCEPRQVERWSDGGLRRFYNLYGPTECTIAAVAAELSGRWERALPIGCPLPGCRVYLLDEDMTLCEPGRAGELYIGGPQVSLGYDGDPRRTASRFLPDPFAPAGQPGARMYRTGDLAAWNEEGVITFLGRVDRQVKIHGQRVEPGEIEAVLTDHPAVRQAVVDVVDSAVHAYVVPASAPPPGELRAYCASRLPAAMVPVRVIRLERLPLTLSAKIDFAELRRLAVTDGTAPRRAWAPRDPFEHAVAQSWAQLLCDGQPAGPGDDFFQAGGDSLTAMRLASALEGAAGRAVSVEDVFLGRTLAGIAARLAEAPPAASALPSGSPPALSSAQRRLWFIEQFAPGTPLHNIVIAENLLGPLDTEALEGALSDVADRQSVLRWRLHPGDRGPSVTVAPPGQPPPLTTVDLSRWPRAQQRAAVAELLREETRNSVALMDGPLWRVRLVRLAPSEHVLAITLHHIVFDGWSQDVLYRELSAAYRRRIEDPAAAVPGPSGVTFADYTAWTAEQAKAGGAADTEWWRRHLEGASTVLDLPRDRPRPAVQSFRGERLARKVDKPLAAAVARFAAGEGTTVGTVLLTAFGVLLRRLTGEQDLIIGVPVADRGHADFEELIGFLVQTLPIRLRIDDGATFAELARRTGDELAAARRHGRASLERIVEASGVARDLSRNPLFQVMFNVYNFTVPRLELCGLRTRPEQAGLPGSIVDLTLYVVLHEGGFSLEVAYTSDLYDQVRIDALVDSFVHLVRELVTSPGRPAGKADARPAGTALPDWRAPLVSSHPAAPGLIEQIRAVALAAPDTVAVEHESGSLTYAALTAAADRISGALRAAGAGPGDVVAVLAERTPALPAVLLGTLSSGARWLILEGGLPGRVLGERLSAAGPRLLARCAGNTVAVSRAADGSHCATIELPGHAPVIPPLVGVPPGQRGYLSLTSGTTGTPKLIDAPEAPLVHFLNWYRALFHITGGARFALLSGLAYDPLLRCLFTPLVCGATLAIPAPGLLRDPAGLTAWLAGQRITVAHLTPQMVRMAAGTVPRAVESLRLVALAGDQLTLGDVAALRRIAPRARLVNFYGAAETPQAQGYYEIPPGPAPAGAGRHALAALASMAVPVGEGIDGTQLLVMSVCGRPAAVGELGEVVIRGRHLALGYAGAPQGSGPFAPLPGAGPGPRVYRTGDLGRYRPDGMVVLAGRADDQVKVRGFRVELGHIETALCAHPHVRQAAVRLLGHDGASALHAYAVPASPALGEAELLRHLRDRLPAHAVPSGVTLMPALPLTANGKVDRARLPLPGQRGRAAGGPGEPEADLERAVAGIWHQVLGLPRIGVDDNFFEVGGHSMAIIEVQRRLEHELSVPVPVVDLFRFPTIRGLAGYLATGSGDRLHSADARGRMRHRRAALQHSRARRGDASQ